MKDQKSKEYTFTKPERKRPLERSKRRRSVDIKTDFKKIVWVSLGCINPPQGKDWRRCLVKTAVNSFVPY
jgi:hypothetical protein